MGGVGCAKWAESGGVSGGVECGWALGGEGGEG